MKRSTLEDFISLTKNLNFSRAARERNLTQPAMSKNILALEKELGFTLIVRERQLKLTAAGRHYLRGVQILLQDYDNLVKQCSTMAREETSLVLAVFSNIWLSKTVTYLEGLCDAHLAVVECDSPQSLFERLADGTYDLAICSDTSSPNTAPFATVKLETIPLRIGMEKSNPLASNVSLGREDLRGISVLVPFGSAFELSHDAILQVVGKDLGLRFLLDTCINLSQYHNISLEGSLIFVCKDVDLFDRRVDLVFFDELDGAPIFFDRYLAYSKSNQHPRLKTLLAALSENCDSRDKAF
jgi:DNA-binding transcriptional LysR family regulator